MTHSSNKKDSGFDYGKASLQALRAHGEEMKAKVIKPLMSQAELAKFR